MTVPDASQLTALAFGIRIDSSGHFRDRHGVSCHLGLTPRRINMGRTNVQGRIDRRRVRLLHATLQASYVTVSVPCDMAFIRFAVARKRALVLRRMWLSGSKILKTR